MCGGPSSHEPPADDHADHTSSSTHADRSQAQSSIVWHEVESEEYPGHTYFLNELTGVAQWDRPAELCDASSTGLTIEGGGGGSAESSTTPSFPGDVVAWARKELALSPSHEAEFLRQLCGTKSDFGVTELSDLKEIEGEHLEHLLELVPIAKRKKFEQALEVVRSTDIFFP
jgi:hypothetical protein